jgi:hypothetical protein
MNTTIREARNALSLQVCAAFFIALILLLPTTIQGQWTTPDANQNINNTNSGNVGVKTTTPEFPLQVNGSTGNILGLLYTGSLSVSSGAGIQSLTSTGPSAADQRLGFYTFGARSGGTSYNPIAIQGFSSQAWTLGTAQGGYMTFSTTPNDSATRQERMRIDQWGQVGIGTTTPSGLLSLRVAAGDVIQAFTNAGGSAGELHLRYKYESSLHRVGFTDSFGNWLFFSQYASPNTNSVGFLPGKLGVGIQTPDSLAKLHLYGSGGFGQDIQTTTADWTRLRFVTPTRTWGFFLDGQSPGAIGQGNFGLFDYTANAWRMVFNTTGNVGVGVLSPNHKLDVSGNINASTGLCINGDCKSAWSQVGGGASQWADGASSSINYGTGNVGIGTTTPTQKLEINGAALVSTVYGSSAASGTLTLQSTSSTTKGAINIGVDQTTTTNIAQSGTPGNKLIVASDRLIVNNGGVRVNGAADHGDLSVTKLNLVNSDALQFRTTNPNIQSNGSLLFTAQNVGGDNVRFNVQNSAISNAFVIDSNTATPARLFDVRDAGASKFTVTGGGNVGIGTTAPANKLHVAGSITVDGNINAKYQDLAEWVDSSQELAAGTVVVLDAAKSNHVIASTQSYDSRVAGVISLKPGVTLGEAGEGRVLVATTGRVKIKVDATNGPINIGDLLVTSDKEGVAMKSVAVEIGGIRIHRPGTLIGKALEPLAQGTGEILVLLSLQ